MVTCSLLFEEEKYISSTQLPQCSHVWRKKIKSQFYEGLIHVWKPELPHLDRHAWVMQLISLTSMYNCKASRTFYSYKLAKQLVRDIHKLNILKDNDGYGGDKSIYKVFIIHLHIRMKINMGLKKNIRHSMFSVLWWVRQLRNEETLAGEHAHTRKILGNFQKPRLQ